MNIGIQTWGSRGDINPWIALGQGLAEAGHRVCLYYTSYTGSDFTMHESPGLTIKPTKIFSEGSRAYEKVISKKIYNMEPLELTDYMVKDIFDLFHEEIVLAAKDLCKNNELIINNPNLYQTAAIAEKYNVPRINLLVESQYTPNNSVSDFTADHINLYFLERVNIFRQSINLPPIADVRSEAYNSPLLNILIYSKIFCNENENWDNRFRHSGYLELKNPPEFEMPAELKQFLDAGEPPVFFSMGSLSFFEGESFEILQIFNDAINLSGCRAIIQGNFDQMTVMPGKHNVFLLGYMPHNAILPMCSGMVHHGGAGTTHTSILNGCPSIIIAYAWDQFYWGRELLKMGICPGMMKRKYLDPLQLAGAIRKLMKDPEYKMKTDDARRKMKREKGVAKTVRIIEEFVSEHKNKRGQL
ncbi:MAG: glycosyltransferase family 1 protein [Bacteroidales bacterium]|nr:glycosyltransferase family 1 protein [Bacteroidales bacterium]